MKDLSNNTLAEIVISNHLAAAIFEKYNLDFCCTGKKTLNEACAEKNLPVEVLVGEIEKTNHCKLSSPKLDFERLTLNQLIEYIVNTHHCYLKKEFPLIKEYLHKVVARYGVRHPELYNVFALFAAIKEEVEYHMQREETILFKRIREIERIIDEGKEIVINSTYLLAHVNMVEQEHFHTGSLLKELQTLTDNYTPPADACTTFRLAYSSLEAMELDLHQHLHLENNILFPKAMRMFDMERICSLN